MGLVGIILNVLFVVLVIMTFISAPATSSMYYKEMGKSVVKVGYWCKDVAISVIGLFQKNTTTNEVKE